MCKPLFPKRWLGMGLLSLWAAGLSACGGGSDGPAIDAAPQTLSFETTPSLMLGGTAQVRATASSGLSPSYTSQTSALCSIDATTGLATGLALGDCIIEARQTGA